MTGHSFAGVGPAATLLETLEAWRQDRSSTLWADRVDEASAHVARLEVPPRLQRWWTDHARAYDPVTAATLLDTLRVQARGSNVSWRTIMLRDTPLVAALREAGFVVPDGRSEWLNLYDRIGLALTWPDDPRVAIALANLLHEAPFADQHGLFRRGHRHPTRIATIAAIVKRVVEIGDLRALERVAALWSVLDPTSKERITDAAARAPRPRAGGDTSLAAAWQAVLDEPFALAPRLVLADAYLERGDARGEMIALQCAPLVAIEKARAAGESIDEHGLFGVAASRIYELTQAHWHHWLGDAALVVSRSSRFRGGLLSEVYVGHLATPAWAWQRVAAHRELCALHRLAPLGSVDRAVFADFVGGLVRMPAWLQLDDATLAHLLVHGPLPSLTGVAFALARTTRRLPAVLGELLVLAPNLARLDLQSVRDDHLPDVLAVAHMSRRQLRLQIDFRPTLDDRAILDELRTLPHVRVLTYRDDW